ncbi:hypothetical protein [Arenibacter lacus]|uniref:hypothetical protein n=1 Tax=Arenibacter lacus TaxID=2608629 RepID=UPI00123DCA7B|nr:hypothetical protein [Arenibacter lacus]
MEEFVIIDNSTGIVEAKNVLSKVREVDNRINAARDRTQNLLVDLNSSSNSIQHVIDGNVWYKYLKKSTLLDLIRESSTATHNSISSISELIKSNNDNTKDLAEMIGVLVMLSGTSFEKIKESSVELEKIVNDVKESTAGSNVHGFHINKILAAHFDKVRADKERAEEIELRFNVLNENLNEVALNCDEINTKLADAKKDFQSTFIEYENKQQDINIKIDSCKTNVNAINEKVSGITQSLNNLNAILLEAKDEFNSAFLHHEEQQQKLEENIEDFKSSFQGALVHLEEKIFNKISEEYISLQKKIEKEIVIKTNEFTVSLNKQLAVQKRNIHALFIISSILLIVLLYFIFQVT